VQGKASHKFGGLIERWHPHVLGIGVAIAFAKVFHASPLNEPALKDIFSSALNLSGIAVGFLATANAIVLSLDNKPIVTRLKELGAYTNLVKYLIVGIRWAFTLALASAAVLLYNQFTAVQRVYAIAAWLGIGVVCGLACFRIARLFASILNDLAD
jgi:hypothetical protein